MRDCNVALVQVCSGPDIHQSLAAAAAWTRRALDGGAELVALPENFWGIGPEGGKTAFACDLADPESSPILARMAAISAETDALIALGGLPERAADGDPALGRGLVYNTSALLRRGTVVASYRKIHRFDVTLADGSTLTESATVAAGSRPTAVRTSLGTLGLSICYDLRFPTLYQSLVAAGAEIILIPAAFTLLTGIDHWSVLLRARAIETQSYVLAPAQFGRHNQTRHSFGHSMIIDPWGTVIAQASPTAGVVTARLDAAFLTKVRGDLPSLRHRALPDPPTAHVIDLSDPA